MTIRAVYVLAIVSLLALFSTGASAASMRCGSHIVQDGGRHGPTMYAVLKKCGEPSERNAYYWIYRVEGKVWRLNFSSNGILETIAQVK